MGSRKESDSGRLARLISVLVLFLAAHRDLARAKKQTDPSINFHIVHSVTSQQRRSKVHIQCQTDNRHEYQTRQFARP